MGGGETKKNTMKKFIIAIAIALSGFAASAQVTATTFGSVLSNAVTLVTVTSNLTAGSIAPVALQNGKGIAFTVHFNGTQSTNTGSQWFGFTVSTDGTNYSTTYPLTWTVSANATTAVRASTTIGPDSLRGYTHIKLARITNDLVNMASLGITNFTYTIPR